MATNLISLPELRMCAAVTSTDNLVINLWLRSIADSQRFEEQLSTRFPTLTAADRTIELHAAKRVGSLLTPTGHFDEVLPVDPWTNHHTPAHSAN